MSDNDPAEMEVLTVEEAAVILRIGRNAAYAAARLWRSSGGRQGLPCIEIGRTMRVPRAALRHLLEEAPTDPDRIASTPAELIPAHEAMSQK